VDAVRSHEIRPCRRRRLQYCRGTRRDDEATVCLCTCLVRRVTPACLCSAGVVRCRCMRRCVCRCVRRMAHMCAAAAKLDGLQCLSIPFCNVASTFRVGYCLRFTPYSVAFLCSASCGTRHAGLHFTDLNTVLKAWIPSTEPQRPLCVRFRFVGQTAVCLSDASLPLWVHLIICLSPLCRHATTAGAGDRNHDARKLIGFSFSVWLFTSGTCLAHSAALPTLLRPC